MFQSYEYLKSDQDYYHYKIIDTDFEAREFATRLGAVGAIIDCYSKRKLPIAPNLFRCMLYIQDKRSSWTIDKQVEWNRKHNPRWKEIEADMQMYLVFS